MKPFWVVIKHNIRTLNPRPMRGSSHSRSPPLSSFGERHKGQTGAQFCSGGQDPVHRSCSIQLLTTSNCLQQGEHPSNLRLTGAYIFWSSWFPRAYRVCFVSVLGSSPPSLPFLLFVYVICIHTIFPFRMIQYKEAELHYSINLETDIF